MLGCHKDQLVEMMPECYGQKSVKSVYLEAHHFVVDLAINSDWHHLEHVAATLAGHLVRLHDS